MNLRTLSIPLGLAAALALVAGTASAQQVYKWKDANGVTHYAQQPPASGTHFSKVRLADGSEVDATPAPASSAPAASASAAPQATEQARAGGGTQPATSSNQSAFCKQTAANLATLRNTAPVIAASSSGKQEVLNDSARKAQMDAALAQQREYCSSNGT